MQEVLDRLVRTLGPVWEFFWEIALGIAVLWVFFLVMGAVSLGDPLWLSIAMGILGALAVAHYVHVHSIVEHDADLSRRAHALRERRGF
jgi:hypothetical protein